MLSEQGCLSQAAAAPWFGVARREHRLWKLRAPAHLLPGGKESSADLSTNTSSHLHPGLRVFDRV